MHLLVIIANMNGKRRAWGEGKFMRLQTCVLLIAATAMATMLAAAPGMAQSGQPKVRSNPIDPITGYPIYRGFQNVLKPIIAVYKANIEAVPALQLQADNGLLRRI